VTPLTEIFLVADHAAAPVPPAFSAVSEFAPNIVVVLWLLVLMTRDTLVFAVTDHAFRVGNLRLEAVPNHPVGLVCRVDRTRFGVAQAAILERGSFIVMAAEANLF
jgi:hypothetical protein